MEKRKDGQIVAIAALAIAIIFMSVGFAVFTQNLNINGTATVEEAKWDIHFDDSTFNSTGNVTVTPTFDSTTTTLSWSATLSQPGDYVEFTVDAKNYGTFDANLKTITLDGLTDAQKKYLKLAKMVNSGRISKDKFVSSYRAWKNHISHGNCYKLGKITDDKILKTLKEQEKC